jgi:hypothetical protein
MGGYAIVHILSDDPRSALCRPQSAVVIAVARDVQAALSNRAPDHLAHVETLLLTSLENDATRAEQVLFNLSAPQYPLSKAVSSTHPLRFTIYNFPNRH